MGAQYLPLSAGAAWGILKLARISVSLTLRCSADGEGVKCRQKALSSICCTSLAELNLFTLEKRRIRGDMINMYKYIRGPYSELGVELFTLRSTQRTRGHSLRLEEKRFPLQIRNGLFTVSVKKLVDGA